jgi:sugar phosphate isomerase/epimerase
MEAREHYQWVRNTKRSLDFAAQVHARVLVCHLGSVKYFLFNPANRLERYLDKHPDAALAEDKRYQAMLAKSLSKLRARKGRYWERAQSSVKGILDFAAQRGVSLGIENREKFCELPLDADFPEFLSSLPDGARAGYWHDCGHAYLKSRLGLLNHREHLEKNAGRLIGFHLHDVNAEGQDHQAVGSGKIDFKMVSEFWRPHHLLTLELGPRASSDDVRASKERIEALIKS